MFASQSVVEVVEVSRPSTSVSPSAVILVVVDVEETGALMESSVSSSSRHIPTGSRVTKLAGKGCGGPAATAPGSASDKWTSSPSESQANSLSQS